MSAVARLLSPVQPSHRREVLPELADLFHDGCLISDRDHSDMATALDGAAISHGFRSWRDAETQLNNPKENT